MTKAFFLSTIAFFNFQFLLQADANFSIDSDTIVQNFHRADQKKSTNDEALIRLLVTDFRKNKLGSIPLWVHDFAGNYWEGTTDANGELFFLLPINQKYAVNIEGKVDYRKFEVPKEKKCYKTFKVVLMTSGYEEVERNDTIFQQVTAGIMPAQSRVLVNVNVRDLIGKPLEKEHLFFNAKASNKVFQVTTNAQGKAVLLLPKGETYCVHSTYYRDITCKTYAASEFSRTSQFNFKTISSTAFEKRAAERKVLLAQRDSIRHLQRLRDSLLVNRNALQNFYLQHRYKERDYAAIENAIQSVASKDRQGLAESSGYYALVGEEIKAIFHRNKDNWREKQIIANIDCSMYQYIDELLVWNYSDQEEQGNNKYWLFNGFNYDLTESAGHSRRGIFEVKENTVAGFFNTIDKIVNFSCAGSRLENVTEALILGAKQKTPNQDLIFIADNYSDVSDLALIDQLTVPVHVLLTDSNQGINENYLEIAYRTNGSVHTIQEDVSAQQLNALNDGDLIKIGRFEYSFFKGKFLKVG